MAHESYAAHHIAHTWQAAGRSERGDGPHGRVCAARSRVAAAGGLSWRVRAPPASASQLHHRLPHRTYPAHHLAGRRRCVVIDRSWSGGGVGQVETRPALLEAGQAGQQEDRGDRDPLSAPGARARTRGRHHRRHPGQRLLSRGTIYFIFIICICLICWLIACTNRTTDHGQRGGDVGLLSDQVPPAGQRAGQAADEPVGSGTKPHDERRGSVGWRSSRCVSHHLGIAATRAPGPVHSTTCSALNFANCSLLGGTIAGALLGQPPAQQAPQSGAPDQRRRHLSPERLRGSRVPGTLISPMLCEPRTDSALVVWPAQGIVLDEDDEWRPVCLPLHHAGSYWYEHWSEAAKKKKREIKSKETDGVLYVSSSVMQWGPDMTVHSAANTHTHHRAHAHAHMRHRTRTYTSTHNIRGPDLYSSTLAWTVRCTMTSTESRPRSSSTRASGCCRRGGQLTRRSRCSIFWTGGRASTTTLSHSSKSSFRTPAKVRTTHTHTRTSPHPRPHTHTCC